MAYAKRLRLKMVLRPMLVVCITGGVGLLPAPSNAASEGLTVYAGPQSVAPEESIHISVEVMMGALKSTDVKLTYTKGGAAETVIGSTKHGLASFELAAQKTTGQMSFSAEVDGTQSEAALVTVLAGPPKPFALSIQQSQKAGFVDVISDVVTDNYGNALSALSLVSIDWIDAEGLKSSQNVHLSRGAIALSTACPPSFVGAVRIRAGINSVVYTSPDLSPFCSTEGE